MDALTQQTQHTQGRSPVRIFVFRADVSKEEILAGQYLLCRDYRNASAGDIFDIITNDGRHTLEITSKVGEYLDFKMIGTKEISMKIKYDDHEFRITPQLIATVNAAVMQTQLGANREAKITLGAKEACLRSEELLDLQEAILEAQNVFEKTPEIPTRKNLDYEK